MGRNTKPIEPYHHVKVPGFGCTYPHDFICDSGDSRFELRRLIRDETFDRDNGEPILLLPIEAGRGSIKVHQKGAYTVDYEHLVVIPRGFSWSVKATTPILKILMVEISSRIIAASRNEFNLDPKVLEKTFSKVQKVTRTTWLNEIFHRYAFEKSIAKFPTSASAKFLELEIVKEVYYAVSRTSQLNHNIPFFIDLPEALRRALTLIEQRLHTNLTADDIASVALTSKPTLVRLFRTHLKSSPIKYLWNRRLDEADRLLVTGRYSVSEVAALLGFSESSAFSKSYMERFGVRPSAKITK